MSPVVETLLQGPLVEFWETVISSLPRVAGAFFVFAAGLALASAFRRAVLRLMETLHAEAWVEKSGIKATAAKAGIHLHVGQLLAWVVKWFFVVATLVIVSDLLGWREATAFLQQALSYVPQVLIAVFIMLAGIVLGNFVGKVVRSAVEAARLSSGAFLAGIARWAIYVFSLMAALVQLDIAEGLIQVLFTGFVAMLALAGGLAFGLGGRGHAEQLITQVRKDFISDRSRE